MTITVYFVISYVNHTHTSKNYFLTSDHIQLPSITISRHFSFTKMPGLSPFKDIELFGGAIKTQLSNEFVDASDFRQIPDNQEVYVHGTIDDSIIFDLMEKIDNTNDFQALKEHLDDITQINTADPESQLVQLYVETYPLTKSIKSRASPAYITVAIEPAKKWGRHTKLLDSANASSQTQENTELLDEPLLVLILVLVRLPDVGTDFVISYNVPITKVDDLQSLQTVFSRISGGNGVTSSSSSSATSTAIESLPLRVQGGINNIRHVLDTIDVVDWSLFG